MIVKYHSMLLDSRQNLRCKPFPWPSHIGLKSIYPSSPPFMEGFFFTMHLGKAVVSMSRWRKRRNRRGD